MYSITYSHGSTLVLACCNKGQPLKSWEKSKFCTTAQCPPSTYCYQDLHRSLCKLDQQQSNDWIMLFNTDKSDKCKVLHFGTKNVESEYMLGNQVLESVTMERDLGVLVQDSLKVSEQCTNVVKTCNRILGMIR